MGFFALDFADAWGFGGSGGVFGVAVDFGLEFVASAFEFALCFAESTREFGEFFRTEEEDEKDEKNGSRFVVEEGDGNG